MRSAWETPQRMTGKYAGGVRGAPLEQSANAGEVFVVFLQGLGEDKKALAGEAVGVGLRVVDGGEHGQNR